MAKKILVVTAAHLIEENGSYYGYAPYIAELDLWASHVAEIDFACPVLKSDPKMLRAKIDFNIGKIHRVQAFNVKSVAGIFKAIIASINNFAIIFNAMRTADHIHLRCPGNIALIGCVAQIFFPKKTKSAKYAGNWDPKSKQPLSYRMQKWILNNTFLTRNMQVLVYGNWAGNSKNIKPFFTASYREVEKFQSQTRSFDQKIRLIYVGTLSPGKRPLYAIQLVEALHKKNLPVRLDIYGEGSERDKLEQYIDEMKLNSIIHMHGNQPKEIIVQAYRESHFVILASKSEGWPKAVAEAMFWGCVPLASTVSCVPEMLGNGARGILLRLNVNADTNAVAALCADGEKYQLMSAHARDWSQEFTIEKFDSEIKKIISC